MPKIVWDKNGEKRYEAGVDRGVLYPRDSMGVPWNGLLSVDEKTEEADTTPLYFDGVKRGAIIHPGDFAATLRAYTYPDEFLQFSGYTEENAGIFFDNQPRKMFDLSYRTLLGNDIENLELGYKIHLVYNVFAEPSDSNYNSINRNISPEVFSWDLSAIPVEHTGIRPTAHVIIDSTKTYPSVLESIEEILYGKDGVGPRMISIYELSEMLTIHVWDNGDGTWTITGPDDLVYLSSADEYVIDAFGIDFIDDTTFTISSS